MHRSRPRYDCASGRHHSDPAPVRDGDVLRSTCLRCGCALMRTEATRRWIFSGALGATLRTAPHRHAG